MLAIAASAGAHAGHTPLLVGPPAPEFAFAGSPAQQQQAAAAARDTRGNQRYTIQYFDAPLEQDGECTDTAPIDGLGESCRTRDGLVRTETADGGSVITHGPDYVEAAIDANPTELPTRMVAAIRHASKSDILCVPASERHIRLVYAIPADGEDRSAAIVPELRQSAYEMSAVIDNEARSISPTAGRRLRVLCDGNGDAVVDVFRLRSTQSTLYAGGFSSVITDVHVAEGVPGGVGTSRYLVFYDADLGSFSGIGQLYGDDRASVTNYNNTGGMVALQDNSSGGASPNWFVLLHESTHNMGGVQDSAPDASGYGHCIDGNDVECYEDGSGLYTDTVCALIQYDCDHDTYFNPTPTAGSHLATKWNVANPNNTYLDAFTAPADNTAPTAPTNLAGQGGGTFVRLTWTGASDAGSGVSAYRIYRQNGANWDIIDDSWPGDTSYDATWTGIATNTSYTFRVTAYDRRGNESTAAQLTTSSGSAGLTRTVSGTIDAPTNARVTANTSSSVTVAWDPIVGSDTTRYRVKRRVSPAGSWATWTTGGSPLQVTSLAPGTMYDFVISAYDYSGRESSTITIQGSTTGGSDVTAPLAPTNVRIASSAGTSPTVAWDAAATAVSYLVQLETSPGVWTTLGSTADLDFVARSMQYGSTKQLGVIALDASLNASPRATVSWTSPPAPDQSPPSEPSPTITGKTQTSISVSWTSATDNVGVVGYRVYVARSDTGQWNLGASTTSALSATVTGLNPGVQYWVDVFAIDAAGYTSSTTSYNIVTTNADTTAPGNISGLTASGQTPSSVNLSWNAATDNTGIANYKVFRREVDLSWTLIGTTTSTSYTPTGLAASTSYTFGVRAVDLANLESPSTISVTTSTTAAGPPDTQAPTQPAGASAGTPTASTIPLSWSASTDDVAVTTYRVYRQAPNPSGTPIATVTAPATSTTITGLTSQTAYTFTITALDAAGNESSAATVNASTLDVTPPSQPTGVATTNRTTTTITLGWNASTDSAGGGVQYRIYRQVSGSWVLQTTTSSTSWQATSLTSSTSYSFAVASIDGSGNESAKTSHLTSTLDVTAPTQPGTISASSITDTSMSLSWGASSDDVALANYRVYRQAPNASGTPILTPSGTSAAITGLTSGVSYTFAVTAVDAAGNESPTRTITVSTQDVVAPGQPGSFAGSALSQSSVRLTWNASTDNVAVTGYRVLRVVSGVASQVTTTTLLQYDVTGLQAATAYRFQVEAYDAAGNVSARGTVDVTTPDTSAPTSPTNGTVPSRSDTALALAWTGSTDNVAVTGYRIYRTAPTASGTPIGTTTGATSYTATGLSASTAYTFEVAAIDAAGNESPHHAISGTTLAAPDTTPPTTPTNLAASNVTATGARLTWTASTDASGVASYRVEVFSGSWTLAGTTSGTTWDLTGLAQTTAYSYRVLALDAASNVSAPATVQFTTPSAADVTPPSAPPGTLQLTAAANGTVGMSWIAANDNVGVTGYHVYRRDGSGAWNEVGTTSTTSITLTEQPVGTFATYGVAAQDAAGNIGGILAGQVQVPAPLRSAPSAPAWVTATPTMTSITLSWAGDDATDTSWNVDVLRNGTLVESRTLYVPTALFVGYLPATTLTFNVRARNDGGTSGAASITATTLRDTIKPTTPKMSRAVARGRGTATLNWTASLDTYGISRYEVRLAAPRLRPIVIRAPQSARSANVTRLVAGKTYLVQVRAIDRYGNTSAWSNFLRLRAR